MGSDGKTAFERVRGRCAKSPGLEFGEKVLWRKSPSQHGFQALQSVWADGVYLGYRWNSGEHVVGDGSGVWKTQTFQRRPYEERWNREVLEWIGGVPWHQREGDPDADGIMDQDDSVRVVEGKKRIEGLGSTWVFEGMPWMHFSSNEDREAATYGRMQKEIGERYEGNRKTKESSPA